MGWAVLRGMVGPLQPLGVAVFSGGRQDCIREHRSGGRRRGDTRQEVRAMGQKVPQEDIGAFVPTFFDR